MKVLQLVYLGMLSLAFRSWYLFGAFLGPFQDPSGVPRGSVGALLGTMAPFGGPMATQGGAGSLEDALSNYFWGFGLDCFERVLLSSPGLKLTLDSGFARPGFSSFVRLAGYKTVVKVRTNPHNMFLNWVL